MAAAETLTTPVVEKDNKSDDSEQVHEAAVDIARAYEVEPPEFPHRITRSELIIRVILFFRSLRHATFMA